MTILSIVICGLITTSLANTVNDFCGSYTVEQWVNDLISSNLLPFLSLSNIEYAGICSASGSVTFTDDNYVGQTLLPDSTTALVLTTGDLDTAASSINTINYIRTSNSVPGDSDLTQLVGTETFDASVIEFDIVSSIDIDVCFTYMFASDEYLEYVGSSFNDVFAFWFNDQNVAMIDDTVVSINNVNNDSLSQYFTFNTNLKTEYDGLTVPLETEKYSIAKDETVHVKLAIADTSDDTYDSAVFIKPGSFEVFDPCDDFIYINDGTSRNFDEAESECINRGYNHLATIDTLDELLCVANLLNDDETAWIGLKAVSHHKGWHYFNDGTQCPLYPGSKLCLSSDYWENESGEPTPCDGNNYCVQIKENSGKLNNDLQCETKLTGFVCNNQPFTA